MTDRPTLSSSTPATTREEAAALRGSFDPDERARIEETVADLLDLLGKRHAMAVLSAFAFTEGPLRFSDLEAELDAAPNTLSTRLRELTDVGLLDRRTYDEMPPRVEYTPTEKARALFPVFAHLHHWAVEYDV
jgi:DNA-binding HxlR family transcriptional regulator